MSDSLTIFFNFTLKTEICQEKIRKKSVILPSEAIGPSSIGGFIFIRKILKTKTYKIFPPRFRQENGATGNL